METIFKDLQAESSNPYVAEYTNVVFGYASEVLAGETQLSDAINEVSDLFHIPSDLIESHMATCLDPNYA